MATPAQISANKVNAKKGGRPVGAKANHTIEAETSRALLVRMFEERRTPIFNALLEKAELGDLGAVKELHDRVWGRAAQSLEVTGKDGSSLIPKSDIDIQKVASEVAVHLKSLKT